MLTSIARLLCLLAAIVIMEVPTALLQSYAWASMLNQRVPEQGLSEALASTFDGEHPCEHCLTVQEIQNTQQDAGEETPLPPSFQLGNFKLTQLNNTELRLPPPPRAIRIPIHFEHVLHATDFSPQVPTPPPRVA
ncbi:hypothetical protein [Rubritalea tangerina]|uniref:DUF2946 domain-containing protein n=1 Tax=Rubritalea tangerina TaxID=430798 RepID=A0ABW4ZC18_9BACT